jgi:hypothetical protein
LRRFLETIDDFFAISIDQENEDDDAEIQVDILLQDKI